MKTLKIASLLKIYGPQIIPKRQHTFPTKASDTAGSCLRASRGGCCCHGAAFGVQVTCFCLRCLLGGAQMRPSSKCSTNILSLCISAPWKHQKTAWEGGPLPCLPTSHTNKSQVQRTRQGSGQLPLCPSSAATFSPLKVRGQSSPHRKETSKLLDGSPLSLMDEETEAQGVQGILPGTSRVELGSAPSHLNPNLGPFHLAGLPEALDTRGTRGTALLMVQVTFLRMLFQGKARTQSRLPQLMQLSFHTRGNHRGQHSGRQWLSLTQDTTLVTMLPPLPGKHENNASINPKRRALSASFHNTTDFRDTPC